MYLGLTNRTTTQLLRATTKGSLTRRTTSAKSALASSMGRDLSETYGRGRGKIFVNNCLLMAMKRTLTPTTILCLRTIQPTKNTSSRRARHTITSLIQECEEQKRRSSHWQSKLDPFEYKIAHFFLLDKLDYLLVVQHIRGSARYGEFKYEILTVCYSLQIHELQEKVAH